MHLVLAKCKPRTRRVSPQYTEIRPIAAPTDCELCLKASLVGLWKSAAASKRDGKRKRARTDVDHAKGRHASVAEVDTERMPQVWPFLGPERQEVEA